MTRQVVLGLTVLAGIVAGFGCSVFCYDCNCPPGPLSVEATVRTADRAELVGATITVQAGSVQIDYTDADGVGWEAFYSVTTAP